MTKKAQVIARVKEIGLLPSIRVASAEEALFAAEEILECGIEIVEITMTVPQGVSVISELTKANPNLIVGAGTVLDLRTARECIDAGACYVSSPGFNAAITEFAVAHDICAIPGTLTPSEVLAAHEAGADMVKIFPCAAVGGPAYIKALRGPFPDIAFVAAGGVDQVNAAGFIRAGAVALGVGAELIPPTAVQLRDRNWIRELAGRFLGIVQRTRAEVAHPH